MRRKRRGEGEEEEEERGLSEINSLTTIVKTSIPPLRDRNRAYTYGLQCICLNIFPINLKF